MSNFNIELLPQAREFILGMNTSAQEKVLEDLRKARDSNDVSVFKNQDRTYRKKNKRSASREENDTGRVR